MHINSFSVYKQCSVLSSVTVFYIPEMYLSLNKDLSGNIVKSLGHVTSKVVMIGCTNDAYDVIFKSVYDWHRHQ